MRIIPTKIKQAQAEMQDGQRAVLEKSGTEISHPEDRTKPRSFRTLNRSNFCLPTWKYSIWF